MSDPVTFAVHRFLTGAQDALCVHRTLVFLVKSGTVRTNAGKCVLLNGIIFLGSMVVFGWLVEPAVAALRGATEPLHPSVVSAVELGVRSGYQLLWVVPVYGVSFILNTISTQAIAEAAFKLKHGSPAQTKVAIMIRDELYRLLLMGALMAQTGLLRLVPVVGPVAAFLLLSWLYSLYCFEYKWALRGWTLERRLGHLEKNWAYFAGFGAPYTLATFFFPLFVSLGIYALLFPLFLLLAIASTPPPTPKTATRVPVFRFAKRACLVVLRRFRG